jgi:hypothetical protein
MKPHVLSYCVRDSQDRVVDYADTYGRACRIARHHGPGSTVTGSSAVLYTVPAKKEEKPK